MVLLGTSECVCVYFQPLLDPSIGNNTKAIDGLQVQAEASLDEPGQHK